MTMPNLLKNGKSKSQIRFLYRFFIYPKQTFWSLSSISPNISGRDSRRTQYDIANIEELEHAKKFEADSEAEALESSN